MFPFVDFRPAPYASPKQLWENIYLQGTANLASRSTHKKYLVEIGLAASNEANGHAAMTASLGVGYMYDRIAGDASSTSGPATYHGLFIRYAAGLAFWQK